MVDDDFVKANKLYLCTEKGALLHAKSLNTDRAWEVYDYLVDFYFWAKENTEPDVRRKDSTSKKTELAMKPQELSVEDVKQMGMNRRIIIKESDTILSSVKRWENGFIKYRKGVPFI